METKQYKKSKEYLIEQITRDRIVASLYWKKNCFGVNEATILDHVTQVKYVGGNDELDRPSPFLNLSLKLLQLQPSNDIIMYYLNQQHFKYLTCLAMFYIRLTFDSEDVYRLLEPFYKDYRKLILNVKGVWRSYHMDEFVDELLTQERSCSILLPRLVNRMILEDKELLEPRQNFIE